MAERQCGRSIGGEIEISVHQTEGATINYKLITASWKWW